MKLKILIPVFLVVTVLVGIFIYIRSGAPLQEKAVDLRGQSAVSVVLTDNGFEPSEFRIDKGTRVTFSTTNGHPFWPASNPHPIHELFSEFDPRVPIDPDKTWSFVFDKPGIWGFHDHVRSYFTGTVYVSD